MKTESELLKIHDQCKKLQTDDLIPLILNLQMRGVDAKLIEIMKTYLVRSLIRDGFR